MRLLDLLMILVFDGGLRDPNPATPQNEALMGLGAVLRNAGEALRSSTLGPLFCNRIDSSLISDQH